MALQQAGNKEVLVAGIDGTPDALRFVKSGKLSLTIFQDAAGRGAVHCSRWGLSTPGDRPPFTFPPVRFPPQSDAALQLPE